MIHKKNRRINLWVVLIVAAIFWTIGMGFNHSLSASSEQTYKSLKLFADVIELVERTYVEPVDSKELIENAIQGMVHSLDPHSSFLPPEDFKELQVDTQGEFTGIGIQITLKDGMVTVISPIEGTPAYKAGIEAGDKIVKVDGTTIKDLHEAVKMMRGPKGTPVGVTVLRKGVTEPIEFHLIRDKIPIRSVKHSILKPGYGFVRITNFSVNTTDDLKTALKDLETKDMPLKGLILDMRNNPGGLLDQAIGVSDLFLDTGEIVSIKGRQERNTRIFRATSDDDDAKRDYPIVALINSGSASASEIVAGALQDNKRALILGTASFGKGSVQSVEPLRGGAGLKLTIARYYTPSGQSIQAQGITPDIIVQREFPKETDTEKKERPFLKEKDLKNHLDAKPLDENKKESDKQEENVPEKMPMPDDVESIVGPLNMERLMADNQVKRALEILIGYQLFKQLPG